MPSGPGGRWETWSILFAWRPRARPSDPDSTTACTFWAARNAVPGLPRPWPCSMLPPPRLDSIRLSKDDTMRIFVTGSIAYDYIMVFPGRFRDHILPEKMHVLSVSFLVDSLKRRRGGTAANIAYNLALLGGRPIVVGTVGAAFAAYRQRLESRGVDTPRIEIIPGEHTASCFSHPHLHADQTNA